MHRILEWPFVLLVCFVLQTAGPVETSVNQAAALAVTFRVLQLVSRSCNGVMQLPKALQRLQEVTQAAQLTSDEISCWHLLAIANGLQYCQQAGIQVDILQIAANISDTGAGSPASWCATLQQ